MYDFAGSAFSGMNGLRVSSNPFGGAMPSADDLPGAARVAEEAPRQQAGPKKPKTGLLPMRVGASYAVTIKRPQIPREEARNTLALCKRALHAARQREAEAQAAVMAAAPTGQMAPDLIAAYTKAANERAAVGELYTATARKAGRDPHEIVCTIAQDPTLMEEAFTDAAHPPTWVCLNDRCKGQRWADAHALIADHPAEEMKRRAEPHVYGLWSDVPIDPSAPVVGVLGLIAPVSADGTPVMRIAEAFADAVEEVEPTGDVGEIVAEAEKRRGGGRKSRGGDAS